MSHLINIFRIQELRWKIFITLMFLAIYRVGYSIPLPYIDQEQLTKNMGGGLNNIFSYVSMFSGGNLSNATVFGLGIMPYISASIIFQLLGAMIPAIEKLQKEGEAGRKILNNWTRLATVPICTFQAIMYVNYMVDPGQGRGLGLPGYSGIFWYITMVMTMVIGTLFLMWMGEQIDEYGIGNGISLIIMAGIVARLPAATVSLLFEQTGGVWKLKESVLTLGGSGGQDMSFEKLVVLALLFLLVIMGVVAMTRAQRRIPTQSQRHVRGRRVFGGSNSWLPLKVNQAGVMPVIFASSLLILPYFLFSAISNATQSDLFRNLAMVFERQGWTYTITFVVLIYVFCYFWTAIIFNPKDVAENLRSHGSFIPGYRPGKRTADYLEKVMLRLTYVGAAFLAIIAVIPTMVTSTLEVSQEVAQFYGGTSLLIVVSVALDLVQKINSHLVMRSYPGLTED